METLAGIVQVRRAGSGDADAVLTMVREIAAHEGDADAVAGTPDSWARMLARADVVVLVAERDGLPVGYVSAVRRLNLWLGAEILSLDDLFVRPRHRDAGVGRLLMLELARVAHAERLAIRWEMREDNVAAQRFYARLGATLRRKVIAFWPSSAQDHALAGPR
jgi:ribosomal protein S18 acetylase RimI-like enzyme